MQEKGGNELSPLNNSSNVNFNVIDIYIIEIESTSIESQLVRNFALLKFLVFLGLKSSS
jgi:hypothetical protein